MLDTPKRRKVWSAETSAIAQLTLVRLLELSREPEAVFWMFIFPILLTAGLGIAFRNRPPDVLNVAAVTPELVQALKRSTGLAPEQASPAVARQQLRNGKVALVAEPGPNGAVRFDYDDTNPEGRLARLLAGDAIERAAGRVDRVRADDRLMREPGSRYIDFVVPGLLGMNLMASGTWGIGFAVVDARRRKLLKRLVATPMPKHSFLLSFLLSRMLMLVAEVAVLLGFANLVFGVPIRGNWSDLALICVITALAFSALGLLIASRVKTIEAASGLMNAAMLPMWVLSGVFFSAQRFPNALQPLIKALPLTAAIDALRGNMLQGAGLAPIAPELGILALWTVSAFAVALWIFQWR